MNFKQLAHYIGAIGSGIVLGLCFAKVLKPSDPIVQAAAEVFEQETGVRVDPK